VDQRNSTNRVVRCFAQQEAEEEEEEDNGVTRAHDRVFIGTSTNGKVNDAETFTNDDSNDQVDR
jgi:homoaconitase/3-isopropylmalate dehydratase large subunit